LLYKFISLPPRQSIKPAAIEAIAASGAIAIHPLVNAITVHVKAVTLVDIIGWLPVAHHHGKAELKWCTDLHSDSDTVRARGYE